MTSAAFGSRELFPDLEAFAYLNHAAISPPSEAVQRAVQHWMRRYATSGVGAFPDAAAQRHALKEKLGTLLGCTAVDLALTSSTSHGLINIATCIGLRTSDRVICFDGEFPANVTPWQQTAAAAGAEVVLLPQRGVTDDDLLHAVERTLEEGRVRLIAVSAVQFSTGRAMPVAALTALAHHHGARICVDAIQAIGVMPFDVGALGVDFVASGAHKWLMGLEGVGFVYVRADRVGELRPTVASWLSHEDALSFLLEGADRLRYDRPLRASANFMEGHSVNAVGCAALEAALDGLLSLGITNVQTHVARYNDLLEAGLQQLGFESLRVSGSPSGTLSVLPPHGTDVIELAHRLGTAGVSVSTPDGKLRCSPHWPNHLDEVPRILGLVESLIR